MKKINLIIHAFAYIFGSFFIQGIRFLTLPFFSKIMQPSEYGLLSSYETWVSLMTILVGLQTAPTIDNAWVDYGERYVSDYVNKIKKAGMISASGFLLVSFVFRTYLERTFELPYLYLAAGILQCLFVYFMTLLITKYRLNGRAGLYLIYSIANSVLSIGLGMVFVYCMPADKHVGRILSSVIAAGLVGGIAAAAIVREFKKEKASLEISALRYALGLSFPLIFHAFGSIIMTKLDQMMLLKMAGRSTMGIYSYGTNFGHIIYVFVNACNLAYTPYYYRMKKEGEDAKIVRINRFYMKVLLSGLGGLVLLLPEIIYIMSGEAYYEAVYYAPLLALSFMINFLYTFPVNFEFYHKKTKYIAYATIGTGVMNVILNALLIPRFMGVGAALATLCSTFIQFLIHYAVAKYGIGGYEMKGREFAFPLFFIVLIAVLYYVWLDQTLVRIGLVAVLLLYVLWEVYRNRKTVSWLRQQ